MSKNSMYSKTSTAIHIDRRRSFDGYNNDQIEAIRDGKPATSNRKSYTFEPSNVHSIFC